VFVPSIYKIADPGFLMGDWYLDAMAAYHYPFKLFYARLLHYVSLPLLFLVSYCITLMVYLTGLKKLAKILFKDSNLFYILFPLLLLWPTTGLETNALIGGAFFESPLLATSLAIMAIAYFFESKLRHSFIFAGIATIVHIQIGCCMFIILTFTYILLNRRNLIQSLKDIRLPMVWYFIFFIGYFVFSSYPLTFLQKTSASDVVITKNLFINYAIFRIPHHFVLSSMPEKTFSFILLCLLGLVGITFKRREGIDNISIAFSSVILVGSFMQYIFIEFLQIDYLAKILFFRMTVFVTMLALMYFSHFLYTQLSERKKPFLVFLLILSIIYCRNPLIAILLVSALLLVTNSRYTFKEGALWCFILVLCTLLAALLIYHGSFLSQLHMMFIQGLQGILCKVNIILISIGILFLMVRIRLKLIPYLIPVLTLSILIIGLQIKKGFCYNISTHLVARNEWQELCFWIKRNTSHTPLFITPPYLQGFHLYAERKTLVDFKANPILERDILRWKKRLEDLTGEDDIFSIEQKGFDVCDFLNDRYSALSRNQVIHLAKKYNAEYIIFEKPKMLPFEILYETTHFVIYRLPRNIQYH
jgi:hypothetical protein